MVDLNTLVLSTTGLPVAAAIEINDRGEIVAFATDVNGNFYAMRLIPCDENHPGIEGCDYSLVESAATAHVGPTQTTQEAILSAGQDKLPQTEIIARYHQLLTNRHLRFAGAIVQQSTIH